MLWKNRNLLSKHILKGAHYLDEIYGSMNNNLTNQEKLKIKSSSINHILTTVDTLDISNKDWYRDYYKKLNPNNTYFMSFLSEINHRL